MLNIGWAKSLFIPYRIAAKQPRTKVTGVRVYQEPIHSCTRLQPYTSAGYCVNKLLTLYGYGVFSPPRKVSRVPFFSII